MNALLISKMIAQLMLPPGGIIALALLGLAKRSQWWGRALVTSAFLLLLMFSLSAVRDLLISPLEQRYPPLTKNSYYPAQGDAIVVLGGGVNEKAPEYDGEDFLSEAALMRVAYALHLFDRYRLSVWVSGGRPLHDDLRPEGAVMRDWMIARGVPDTIVHAENGSDNTWQNARMLRPLLVRAGVQRVLLVTTAWHMPRAVWSFQQAGIVVVPAPCDYSSSRRARTLLDWLPDAGVFENSVQALHEYLGLLYYHLRYGG